MAKRINTSVPVSVVVIAKNSSATIEECLRSIMNNNPAEMIVVDGGSRDRTVRQAESLGAKVVYDGGKGPSTARNLGAELSASEFVAYVDSDVVIPPDALSTMLSEIKEAHASAVTSLVRFRNVNGLSYWSWAEGMHLLRWYHVRLRANSYLGTQCCVVRRSVLKSYKFETRFGAGVDDFDLQIRLCRDGLKLVISRVVSVHIKNETFDEFVSHTQSTGKFRNHYFHKYGIGYLKYFPLTMEFYWILDSVLSGRIRLIPYHAVNGVVQTFGFFAGGP